MGACILVTSSFIFKMPCTMKKKHHLHHNLPPSLYPHSITTNLSPTHYKLFLRPRQPDISIPRMSSFRVFTRILCVVISYRRLWSGVGLPDVPEFCVLGGVGGVMREDRWSGHAGTCLPHTSKTEIVLAAAAATDCLIIAILRYKGWLGIWFYFNLYLRKIYHINNSSDLTRT